jgi:hypothetical protein
MKHFITVIAVFAMTSLSARLHAQQLALTPVLMDYYSIKDALVNSDTKVAADKAVKLSKAISNVPVDSLVHKDRSIVTVLMKLDEDAKGIAKSTGLDQQREQFARLSADMSILAKKAQLTAQPVYEEYCPMKKATWLSNDSTIRNPYYGSSMLTCGKVTATLKP